MSSHERTTLRAAFLAGVLVLSVTMPSWALRLVAGPMAGGHTTFSTQVWIQGDDEGTVQLEYWPADQPASRRRTRRFDCSAVDEYCVHIPIHGLQPGKTYQYEVLLNGRPCGGLYSLRTQQAWRDQAPDFRFALGSCLYVPDTLPIEQWILPGYAGSLSILDRIAEQKPELMLWLGDNIYLRPQDYGIFGGIERRYRQVRRQPALQNLLQATHHLAIWDDHDYGPNNADRSYWGKWTSLRLFQRYWANPAYGTVAAPGTYSSFTLYDVDFILLDDRLYRHPNDAPPRDGKAMFGRPQMAWLKQRLQASTASFKVVVGGSQFLNADAPSEGWHSYPGERDDFLGWLAETRISGVLFMSGDRHHTVLLRHEQAGGYPLYELTCSPLSSGAGKVPRLATRNRMVPDTFVGERNFGLVSVSGPMTDRRMTIEIRDWRGNVVWRRDVRGNDLKWPSGNRR